MIANPLGNKATGARTLAVTLHAISRWRERAADGDGTDNEIRAKIGMALLRGRAVRLRSLSERTLRAVTHGALADFHHSGQVVLVLTNDAVVSVYAYEGDRWESVP